MTEYVTHAEFQEFRSDVKERFVRVETRLDTTSTKADVNDMKAEMHNMKAEMIKWIVGTALGLGAVGVTVMTFVLNNAAPKASAPAAAPIIITVPVPGTPAQQPSAPDANAATK